MLLFHIPVNRLRRRVRRERKCSSDWKPRRLHRKLERVRIQYGRMVNAHWD